MATPWKDPSHRRGPASVFDRRKREQRGAAVTSSTRARRFPWHPRRRASAA